MSAQAQSSRTPLTSRLTPNFWSRRTLRQREELIAYLLISPWVLGFLAFILGPMLTSLGLSFTETDLFTLEFVGFDNYTRLLLSFDSTRTLLWTTLYNTAYYVFLSIPLTISVGFFIAVLLNQNISGQPTYRIVYYLPAIIPSIATSLLWLWLFQPEFGLINWALSLVGIEGPRWLFDRSTAKLALVIMSVWGSGSNMLIFLAGLQGIPTELYEAATIDGAGIWRRFRSITIPMISPDTVFCRGHADHLVFAGVHQRVRDDRGQGGPCQCHFDDGAVPVSGSFSAVSHGVRQRLCLDLLPDSPALHAAALQIIEGVGLL